METASPNPYEPPVATSPGTEHPLYDTRHILIATFLGSPLAGAIVMALNYRRLAPEKVTSTIALGVVASVVTFGLAFALPEDFPNMVLPAAYVAAMAGIVKQTQGEAIKRAQEAGEPMASGWRAAGIALGALVVLLAIMFAILFAMPEDKLMLGPAQQHEIFYEDGATEQDARKLYGVLAEAEYFGDHPASAAIAKEDGGWLVTLVLGDGWKDPDLLAFMRELAGELGTKLGGRVRIALADVNLKVRATVDAS